MKYSKGTLGLLVAILIMGTSMNAFGFLGFDNSASWKEEVLLHDGRKVIVQRTQTYGGYAEPASRERSLAEEEWVFQIPGSGQRAVWKSDFRRPPEGDSLMLLQLNFLDGVSYVATSPAGCLAYNHWGRPNPPYIFFKYDGKSWRRISLAEFPAMFEASNVAVGRPDPNHRAGLLTVETIKEENRNLEPHLRQIIREALASSQLCPPELTGFKAPLPISPKDGTGSGK
jgi:hypothetical protein